MIHAYVGGGRQVHRLVVASYRDHPLMKHVPDETLVTFCGVDRRWLWKWVDARKNRSVLRPEEREKFLRLGLSVADRGLILTDAQLTCRACDGTGKRGRARCST